ncbi:MAG: DUF6491 family protein [Acidobacteria bacterium]|nr:DUF6491 family protein [Acidobacteriota bacterium]
MGTGQRILGTLAAVILAMGAAACASTTPSPEGGAAAQTGKTCFNSMDITRFDPLPGPFVYVQVLTNRHYLLMLNRDSAPLSRVWNIQVSPNFPRVCSGTRTPLTYQYQGSVGVYSIVDVQPVQSREEAEALAAEGTAKAPPQQQ